VGILKYFAIRLIFIPPCNTVTPGGLMSANLHQLPTFQQYTLQCIYSLNNYNMHSIWQIFFLNFFCDHLAMCVVVYQKSNMYETPCIKEPTLLVATMLRKIRHVVLNLFYFVPIQLTEIFLFLLLPEMSASSRAINYWYLSRNILTTSNSTIVQKTVPHAPSA